jgi:hypothetical protein
MAVKIKGLEIIVKDSKIIVAERKLEQAPNGNKIYVPYVTDSNHPKFTKGKRLHWGHVSVVLEEGYAVVIRPSKEHR